MMNVLALCLVLISLVTGGVWSPTPDSNNQQNQKSLNDREEVIVKEGHRVVVVEYEKEGDGNTKVSISPHESGEHGGYISAAEEKLSSAAAAAKDKLKEAASVLPNVGQGVSDSQPEGHVRGGGPRELVCDAFGKCKHKIASTLGRTKDKVSNEAHGIGDKVSEVQEDAKEAAGEALGKVKDTVTHQTHEVVQTANRVGEDVNEAASKVKDSLPHKAHEIGEEIRETVGKVKDSLPPKAREMGETVKEKAKTLVKETTKNAKNFDVVDSPKRVWEDIQRNVSNKLEAPGPVKEAAERAADTVHRVKEEGQKDLNEILGRGRDVVHDALTYVMSPETLESVIGVMHLLGFATAYGMCVWVTFVSSYVLAGVLPRQQFGMVQSKIYPVYFKAMAGSIGFALMAHLLSQTRKGVFTTVLDTLRHCNLLASLLMVLANLLYLEPRATKLMFERLKMEKEVGRGTEDIAEASSKAAEKTAGTRSTSTAGATLESSEDIVAKSRIIEMNETLKMLNTYSSFLNVFTLMTLSWHLVYLGQYFVVDR